MGAILSRCRRTADTESHEEEGHKLRDFPALPTSQSLLSTDENNATPSTSHNTSVQRRVTDKDCENGIGAIGKIETLLYSLGDKQYEAKIKLVRAGRPSIESWMVNRELNVEYSSHYTKENLRAICSLLHCEGKQERIVGDKYPMEDKKIKDMREILNSIYPAHSKLYLVETMEEWITASTETGFLDTKVIGLDVEWICYEKEEENATKEEKSKGKTKLKKKKPKPVSLLQMSSLKCTILLRIHNFTGTIPSELKKFLGNKEVIKAGVGIRDDAKRLKTEYDLEINGCIDMRDHTTQQSPAQKSMKSIALDVIGIGLDKSDFLRCGNWEAEPLPTRMQAYGAADSEAGLAILLGLGILTLPKNVNLSIMPDKEIVDEIIRLCKTPEFLSKAEEQTIDETQGVQNLETSLLQTQTSTESKNTDQPVSQANSIRVLNMEGRYTGFLVRREAGNHIRKSTIGSISCQDGDSAVRLLPLDSKTPGLHKYLDPSKRAESCVICDKRTGPLLQKTVVPRSYTSLLYASKMPSECREARTVCRDCYLDSEEYEGRLDSELAEEVKDNTLKNYLKNAKPEQAVDNQLYNLIKAAERVAPLTRIKQDDVKPLTRSERAAVKSLTQSEQDDLCEYFGIPDPGDQADAIWRFVADLGKNGIVRNDIICCQAIIREKTECRCSCSTQINTLCKNFKKYWVGKEKAKAKAAAEKKEAEEADSDTEV